MTDSVRFRVTALATLAVVIVLVATSVGLVAAQRRLLRGDLEDSLRQRATQLLASADVPPGDVLADDAFYQVVAPDGTVASSSANAEGLGPLVAAPPPGEDAVQTTSDLPIDDDSFLVVSVSDDGRVAHAGAALDDINEAGAALARVLWIGVPIVVVLLAGVVWWLVGRTLRPVEAIREEVEQMKANDLTRRVPVPRSDDEIAGLARTMNAMLARVETATRRQQAFVADASHELRSPLTRIRSELEVDLAHPADADLRGTQRSVLAETVGLQRLVDDLLYLARSDAGAQPRRVDPVDLDDLVLTEAEQLRLEGDATIDIRGVSAAQVLGDRDQLARAVHNLTENASRYATSTVTMTLGERDGLAVLTVEDDGPGIAPAERERVFERFTRLDEARGADAGGTGLGLAITRDIVEGHGGQITIDGSVERGSRFVVTLPVAARPR